MFVNCCQYFVYCKAQIIKGLLFDVTDDMTFSFKISDSLIIIFYEISLISAGDSNTHLSVNVYFTTYADYVNTLFDYFSCH